MVTTFATTPTGSTGSKGNTGLLIFAALALAGLAYWQFVWKPEQEKLKANG